MGKRGSEIPAPSAPTKTTKKIGICVLFTDSDLVDVERISFKSNPHKETRIWGLALGRETVQAPTIDLNIPTATDAQGALIRWFVPMRSLSSNSRSVCITDH